MATRLGYPYLTGPGAAPYYPGSSGQWLGGGSGIRPGYGYPGDVSRAQFGQAPLDPAFHQTTNLNGNPATTTGVMPRQLGASPYGQPAPTTPGFTTLNNVKSNLFQGSINNLLNQTNTSAFNPNVNPNVLRTNTKNPALEAALSGMINTAGSYTNPTDFQKSAQLQAGVNAGYGQAADDKTQNRAQFANFQQLFDAQTPGVTANVGQENAAIGSWYNGDVQAGLNANAAAQSAAVNLSAQRALGNLAKNQSILRMTHGDSSYANQQALDTGAGIYADQALRNSALNRENYLTVLNGQQALVGARDRNLDYLSNRQLTPINYRTAMGAAEDSRLAGLGQMDLSNNIYTTPAEQGAQRAALLAQLGNTSSNNNIYNVDNPQNDLGRRIALMTQLQNANNANNFYGLNKPYQPDNSGYFNTTNFTTNPGNRTNTVPYSPNGYTPPPVTPQGVPLQTGPNSPNEIYKRLTGFYPNQDPNYNPSMFATAQQSSATATGYTAPRPPAYNPAYQDWRNSQPPTPTSTYTDWQNGTGTYAPYTNNQMQNIGANVALGGWGAGY